MSFYDNALMLYIVYYMLNTRFPDLKIITFAYLNAIKFFYNENII